MTELTARGIDDILIALIDGLTGFPDAIHAVFPQTQVHTCIVHLVRRSLAVVSDKDRKRVAAMLRQVYRAETIAGAEAALETFAVSPTASATQRSRRSGAASGNMSPVA